MKTVKPFAGVLAPVLTPFRQDLVPDAERFKSPDCLLSSRPLAGKSRGTDIPVRIFLIPFFSPRTL